MWQRHLCHDVLPRCADVCGCRAPFLGAAVLCRAEYATEAIDGSIRCYGITSGGEIACAAGDDGVELRRGEPGAEDGACTVW